MSNVEATRLNGDNVANEATSANVNTSATSQQVDEVHHNHPLYIHPSDTQGNPSHELQGNSKNQVHLLHLTLPSSLRINIIRYFGCSTKERAWILLPTQPVLVQHVKLLLVCLRQLSVIGL
ncbi:uncharacterized protein LOC132066572 [Lycium ferocissimum]|uniref:uncharacterized protein LOC132066572 n=1 Tax=Lycium ferocissimum TaxID=112874 RepID=UPI0028167693|nr:uncharacterized protein LOC132066572 [Lycium ferocissimum]